MPAKEYLEMEEATKLELVALCLRDKLLFRLCRTSGARISEILGLAVEDVDFSHSRINIQHLKARINLSCPQCSARLGKSHTFCPKCGIKVENAVAKEKEHRRIRTIPLDEETLKMLQQYVSKGGPVEKNNRHMLFNMTRQRAWQLFQEAALRAGLPDLINPETGHIHGVSPHKMRDAFAINAVKQNSSGDGIRMLQEYLGHSSITTTMKYRKVAGDELQDWYQKTFGGKEKQIV